MTEPVAQLRQVIVGVPDVEAALGFYRDRLGLTVKFQDGSRFAALELGGITLALAGPGEHPEGAPISLALKVPDVDVAIAEVKADGWTITQEPTDGGHERRASVRDGNGTPLVFYSALRARA